MIKKYDVLSQPKNVALCIFKLQNIFQFLPNELLIRNRLIDINKLKD